jgi:hypothetical protein
MTVETLFWTWANAAVLAMAVTVVGARLGLMNSSRAGTIKPAPRRETKAPGDRIPEPRCSARRADMEMFDHILNWKLREGSHQFPGKDGGTCINEAALVAAGYEYRPIRTAHDMPESFSKPICRYALRLNDEASDRERQQLLPFVTRLACADTPEIERERRVYIASHDKPELSFQQRLQVLERALAIGREADPLGLSEVSARMDEVRRGARSATSIEYVPLIAKLKCWFTAPRKVEPTT